MAPGPEAGVGSPLVTERWPDRPRSGCRGPRPPGQPRLMGNKLVACSAWCLVWAVVTKTSGTTVGWTRRGARELLPARPAWRRGAQMLPPPRKLSFRSPPAAPKHGLSAGWGPLLWPAFLHGDRYPGPRGHHPCSPQKSAGKGPIARLRALRPGCLGTNPDSSVACCQLCDLGHVDLPASASAAGKRGSRGVFLAGRP